MSEFFEQEESSVKKENRLTLSKEQKIEITNFLNEGDDEPIVDNSTSIRLDDSGVRITDITHMGHSENSIREGEPLIIERTDASFINLVRARYPNGIRLQEMGATEATGPIGLAVPPPQMEVPPPPQVPVPPLNNEGLICRICHADIQLPDEIDEVISPCRCAGSQSLVHVECFNQWGRQRCEVCHFRFFAGEEPPEPPRNNINPFMAAAMNVPEDLAQRRQMLNALINQTADTIPETLEDGYRIRVIFIMMMNAMVDQIFNINITTLRTMFYIYQMFFWHVNEVFRIASNRSPVISTSLNMIILGSLTLLVSPFIFIYHEIRNRPMNILNYLKNTYICLILIDLGLDLINHFQPNQLYLTSTSYLLTSNQMCYDLQHQSPAYVTNTLAYSFIQPIITWSHENIIRNMHYYLIPA